MHRAVRHDTREIPTPILPDRKKRVARPTSLEIGLRTFAAVFEGALA
jgi:hypothetical protein